MEFATVFTVVAGLFGLIIGSFLNVVIHRLPRMMENDWRAQCAEIEGDSTAPAPRYNLAFPPSHCPACQRTLRARENVPLLSWLIQGAKCRGCRIKIPAKYPAIELTAALLAALVAWRFGPTVSTVAAIGLTWALIALVGIDLEKMLLPDAITLPLLWAGLLLNLHGHFVPLPDAVLGAAAGYTSLWLLYWIFRLTTGKEGIGHGDFKLFAALGAWLGYQALVPIAIIASIAGILAFVVRAAAAGKVVNQPAPFGPYLAAGGFVVLMSGPAIFGALASLVR